MCIDIHSIELFDQGGETLRFSSFHVRLVKSSMDRSMNLMDDWFFFNGSSIIIIQEKKISLKEREKKA